MRRCITGIANAGLEEGHLLLRQNLLRGVRWHSAEASVGSESDGLVRVVAEEEIPTTVAVQALGAATAHRRRPVWWRATLSAPDLRASTTTGEHRQATLA